MATKLLTPEDNTSFNQKFRQKRFAFFTELADRVRTDKPLRILDVGGEEFYWENMNYLDPKKVHITLLNLFEGETKYPNVVSVKGDATNLSQYADGEFDIVYSNSVIEHLFSKENQQKMAAEIARVGRYYWVQTPNYYFPIEPHWLFPLFHYLPVSTRIWLTKTFSIGHIGKLPQKEAIDTVNEIKLLTEKEMRGFFPDGTVYREYFMGLVKSITLYRFPEAKK